MEELLFDDLDKYLLNQENKIIHQVWFGTIPNKRKAAKAFKSLRKYRDSWIIKNPKWAYMCWNLKRCKELINTIYPHHKELYNYYKYDIQRCDVIRYFILHRYGGLYADMDYYCNRKWDEVLKKYKKNIYLVETPNKLYNDIHISNSLMYSSKGHIFWDKLFIELEINKYAPIYYSRHMAIMFTTGPGILNRVFNKYRVRYKLNYYPYKLFHPYGLSSEILNIKKDKNIFSVHLGKGSWEKKDSHFYIIIYHEYRIIIAVVLILIVPYLIYTIFFNK